MGWNRCSSIEQIFDVDPSRVEILFALPQEKPMELATRQVITITQSITKLVDACLVCVGKLVINDSESRPSPKRI